MPHGRPRAAPFFVVHLGPVGPSLTKGMRSRIAADALDANRSGGSQQRSMWQSAEITSYRIARSFRVRRPHLRATGARSYHAKVQPRVSPLSPLQEPFDRNRRATSSAKSDQAKT